MKTYVLTVSRVFPATHKRKGDQTWFVQGIKKSLELFDFYHPENVGNKIHTVRSNYELWAKRIEQIQEGKAILSIRYWSGKPYNSKQVEICQLDKDSGIGVQKACFFSLDNLNDGWCYIIGEQIPEGFGKPIPVFDTVFNSKNRMGLAANDGLSVNDFKEWFKNYDLSKAMAIIHFSAMRY